MPHPEPVPISDNFYGGHQGLTGQAWQFSELDLAEPWPTDYWVFQKDEDDNVVVKPAFILTDHTVVGVVDTTVNPPQLTPIWVLPFSMPATQIPLVETDDPSAEAYHGIFAAVDGADALARAHAAVEVEA